MLRSRRIPGSPAANSAAGVAFLGEACVSGVRSSFAPLTGAGVVPRVSTISRLAWSSAPPTPSTPAHRRISLKSSTASSLTVRTSPTFVPAQASKLRRPLGPGVRLGRGCWTVFSTLTRPPLLQGCRAFEIRQIVRCQRIDDASGMDFINGGKPVGRERHPPAIGSAQPFQPTRVEQPEP
jgi:hypothetical protein